MDVEVIEKLKDMGFTPEQIVSLNASAPNAVNTPEEPIPEQQETEQVPETTESKEPQAQLERLEASINEKINALTKQLQIKNIKDSEMPETETDTFLQMCNELLK